MWQTIGQSQALELLRKGLDRGVLAHAHLLTGPAHVGKMTLAVDLAKALNCTADSPQRPCGECLACQKIAAGQHPDVRTVSLQIKPDPDETKQRTEIGIDEIAETLHSASLPPFEGKYRVYIVDEAADLSLEAANRLLKTLEEPAQNVVFVLLTESPRRVPATVVSRCQRIKLARVKRDLIEKYLCRYYQVEPEKGKLISLLSEGRPGWAIAAARDPHVLEKRTETIQQVLSVGKSDYAARFAVATQVAQQFGRKRETVYETLAAWLGCWRDVLLAKSGCPDNITNIDFSPELTELARALSLPEIKAAIQSVQEANEQLRLNANARLVLEALMLKLPLPKLGEICLT